MFCNFWKKLFAIKPFNEGFLPEQDGHKVYFVEYGNPNGKPVISFHGGPGGSARPSHALSYDLKKVRFISFDQRGGGRSLPSGAFKNNTAQKTVEDAKRLLDFLKIKGKVFVAGGSWGSTIALLFAQTYPKMVDKLAVASVFLANAEDMKWTLETSGVLYPEFLEKIKAEVPAKKKLLKYYADLINSKKAVDQAKAITFFGAYENVLGSLNPKMEVEEITPETISYNKVFINYVANELTLEENQILRDMDKIKNIKTLIVHNRLDLVCPVRNAYVLHKALPKSKLVIVPELGHGGKLLKDIFKKELGDFL
ncbi:MAG: alpha/beta fold hydrolase [Alphaproteobacteria bacterium]|nr:alpha/beta fold hydrolase [Alphaproteobacteria bacterium]